jgi:hypothetical protein
MLNLPNSIYILKEPAWAKTGIISEGINSLLDPVGGDDSSSFVALTNLNIKF